MCKSAISDDALRTYFRYMREWESQKTSTEKGISMNYKSIEWTKIRVEALHDLYEAAPLGSHLTPKNYVVNILLNFNFFILIIFDNLAFSFNKMYNI